MTISEIMDTVSKKYSQELEDLSWYRDYSLQRDDYAMDDLLCQQKCLQDYLKDNYYMPRTTDDILEALDSYAEYYSRHYFSKYKFLTLTFEQFMTYHKMPIYSKCFPKIFLYNPRKSYYTIHSEQHAKYMKGNIVDQLCKEYNLNNC